MTPPMLLPMTNYTNYLEAYMNDPMVRELCNTKGIYVTFNATAAMVTMYMNDQVHDSSYYQEFSELCSCLTEADDLVIFTDNGGGFVSGAQFITRILDNTHAYTYCIVTDMAASAATIIALHVDELIMNEFSFFMIHAISFGSGGKLNEVQAHTEFSIKQSKKYIEATYANFLTPEEIADVIKGTDIYLDADEVTERFEYIKLLRADEDDERYVEEVSNTIDNLYEQIKQLELTILPKTKFKTKPKPPMEPKEPVAKPVKPKAKPKEPTEPKVTTKSTRNT